jgi:two-component system cell cycle sensor histidine kinase/response regulator CckA
MTDGSVEGQAATDSDLGTLDASAQIAAAFRKAVEAAPIGIIHVDGAKGRYVFANETFARMIGKTREEVLQSDPYQVAFETTHPDERVISRQAIERVAQGADHFQYEKRLVRSDGEICWVSVDLVPTRDQDGRMAFLTFYFTDIDARRNADATRQALEEQLRQAQKLEALGRLAGGVAHDFNNRLLIIMGQAELLRNALPSASPHVARTDLVLDSAQRAAELTRQLLAFSRRQVLKPQSFDLNAVVDNMLLLLERLIGPDSQLATVLGAIHPVVADPGQVEQVIINLAINARDAMPRGGRLILETKDVAVLGPEPSGLSPGDYVALGVRDSGVGIPEAILPRIFEPFFTTKEVGQGTGLGLATVQGIVHQSGGSVRVESREGHGSTFTICLPRAREETAKAKPPPKSPLARGAAFETVLVCEDDDGVRQLIANVLSLRGYAVLEAQSGRHALEVAAKQRDAIDLLVTDLVMPGLGGIELAAKLRERAPRLIVLYISGYTEQATLLSGPLGPDTHFLPKPFLPSDLTRVVCSILERPSSA